MDPPTEDEVTRLRACRLPAERQNVLGQIFQHHRKRLKKVVVLRMDARLRERLDPSDVLQEAFVEVSRRLDEYLAAGRLPLFVWLRFITVQRLAALHRHHLHTQARSRRREVRAGDFATPEASSAVLSQRLAATTLSPSEVFLQEEARLQLERALDQMRAMDREILALRHFEEMSNQEAARVLGIEENVAATRHFRALRRLRRIINGLSGKP